jgi:hypothetical protein
MSEARMREVPMEANEQRGEGIQMQEIWQPIYDTIYLPESISHRTARGFVYPMGQQVHVRNGFHVKTDQDTNLVHPAMLDAPKSFRIDWIDAYFVDDQDIMHAKSRWYAETVLRFSLLPKQMWESPLAKCVAPVAILRQINDDLLSREDIESLAGTFTSKFQKPIEILQQQAFSVEAEFSEWAMKRWTDRTSPVKLVVTLNGEMSIPVY